MSAIVSALNSLTCEILFDVTSRKPAVQPITSQIENICWLYLSTLKAVLNANLPYKS